MRAGVSEEVFLPLPAPRASLPMATSFRSTWLSASLRSLRDRQLMDRYLALLPPQHHAAVQDSVAGTWLDVAVAVAHYEACDALALSPSEQVEIGREATSRAHGTVLGTMVRLAKNGGVTPWVAFGNFGRLWERIWIGGGITIIQLGPKEARVEILQWPCSRIPYVRTAMRGVIAGIVELFCARAYVHELPKLSTLTSLAYRVQWA